MWETGLEWVEAKIQAKLKVSLGQPLAGTEVAWITQRGDPKVLLSSQHRVPAEVTARAQLPQPANTPKPARGGSNALQVCAPGKSRSKPGTEPPCQAGCADHHSRSSFTLRFTWGKGVFK